MPFLKFPVQKQWRNVVFKANVVYAVGKRIHHKFVVLQGLAEDVPEAPPGAVETIPDPGAEAAEDLVLAPKLPSPPTPSESPLPPTSSEAYLRSRGGPWYDVVAENGEVINTNPLRKTDAEELLATIHASATSIETDSSADPEE